MEVAGEDPAHSRVGANPAGAVECGSESLGAAVLAGVEGGEFGGVEGSGGDLPDPDVDVAAGEGPVAWGRGCVGVVHSLIRTRGARRHRREAWE